MTLVVIPEFSFNKTILIGTSWKKCILCVSRAHSKIVVLWKQASAGIERCVRKESSSNTVYRGFIAQKESKLNEKGYQNGEEEVGGGGGSQTLIKGLMWVSSSIYLNLTHSTCYDHAFTESGVKSIFKPKTTAYNNAHSVLRSTAVVYIPTGDTTVELTMNIHQFWTSLHQETETVTQFP